MLSLNGEIMLCSFVGLLVQCMLLGFGVASLILLTCSTFAHGIKPPKIKARFILILIKLLKQLF